MLRALITVALVLGSSAPSEQAKIKPAASKSPDRVSDYQPSPDFDEQAEQQLLKMANQARARAGSPPLQFDDGLIQAARLHAAAMAREQQLSHQLNGEPSLPRRLSAASVLLLDRSGENVALNSTAEEVHQSLMRSPPHRENLLDASYNVAGFAVIRSGAHLYVVQDFGHSLPAYTPEQSENFIAEAVNRARRAAHLPALTRASDAVLRAAVCTMAAGGPAGDPLHA